MKRTKYWILVLTACFFALPVPATGSSRPATLELETERVVVFKDGYGLFVKRGTAVADDDGRVYTEQVPDSAVLGTFWAVAERGASIVSMRAEWVETVDTQTETTACVSIPELLAANEGRTVTLELHEERVVEGRILRVLELAPARAGLLEVSRDSSRIDLAAYDLQPNAVHELRPRSGALVVVEERDGRLVLPMAGIRSIHGRELITTMERTRVVTKRVKRLSFDLGRERAGQPVSLSVIYFTPGIRWIPTYRLDGDLNDSGRLSLQGEILNEVEEIVDADLDLVVGVPHFRFKSVVSPLALEATLRRTLQQAAPGLMATQVSNATFTQRAGEWRGQPELASRDETIMDLAPQLATSGSQDLFVYGVPGFSLRKGGRATVGVWSGELPLVHLHTLDLELQRGHSSSGSSDSAGPSPLRLSENRVWHQLELRNPGTVPWTTGSLLILRGPLPISQELLTYTPPGGSALVPMTVAVDVRTSLEEHETERIPDAIRHNGRAYTRVRKQGRIDLTNYKAETVSLRVRMGFGGRVEEVSDDGLIVLDDFRGADWSGGDHTPNNHSDVTWRIEMQPGETESLIYEMHYYVR